MINLEAISLKVSTNRYELKIIPAYNQPNNKKKSKAKTYSSYLKKNNCI